jgi:hypothetical protein
MIKNEDAKIYSFKELIKFITKIKEHHSLDFINSLATHFNTLIMTIHEPNEQYPVMVTALTRTKIMPNSYFQTVHHNMGT